MKLYLLGVSGPFPASGGATSGYLLSAGDQMLQLDFGSGVLSRLTSLFPPESLNALLISHWHFDHTCDLLPLIYRLQAAGRVLDVYGPADPSSELRRIAAAAPCFVLHDTEPGQEIRLGSVLVKAGPARHPVPGVGYRVEAEGKAFGYTGDTNTLPGLSDFYRGCDLLLADGLFPRESWNESLPHLSAELAAGLARDAEAKRLILTHLNPLYSPAQLLKEARPVFPEVSLAEAGAVQTI